jgi:hypothetical protein
MLIPQYESKGSRNIGRHWKQDMQCTYTVNIEEVCSIIVAVEEEYVLQILSVRL